jgi:hypothetical protein
MPALSAFDARICAYGWDDRNGSKLTGRRSSAPGPLLPVQEEPTVALCQELSFCATDPDVFGPVRPPRH